MFAQPVGRPPYEGVDRNTSDFVWTKGRSGRPPYEGVDRNLLTIRYTSIVHEVALRTRAWIETLRRSGLSFTRWSPSVRGRG